MVQGQFIVSSGAWSYAPNNNFSGNDSFTVTATDDSGNTTTQVISVTVVNTVTTFGGDTSGSGSGTITGTLTASDPEGLTDGSIFTVSTQPSNGSAMINASSGVWHYFPSSYPSFQSGNDSFTVTATDDAGNATTQVISVTVIDRTACN